MARQVLCPEDVSLQRNQGKQKTQNEQRWKQKLGNRKRPTRAPPGGRPPSLDAALVAVLSATWPFLFTCDSRSCFIVFCKLFLLFFVLTLVRASVACNQETLTGTMNLNSKR